MLFTIDFLFFKISLFTFEDIRSQSETRSIVQKVHFYRSRQNW